MEEAQHRCHHESEHLWHCGQLETKNPKLPGPASGCEPEKPATRRVDRDLKVRILQIYGDHPVSRSSATSKGLSEQSPSETASDPLTGSEWRGQ